MARTQKAPRLVIKNFAQIGEIDIEFGDLTTLVGPQGTGKSLALQWLKTALDGKALVARLRDAGQTPDDEQMLLDLIFGVGMGTAWNNAPVHGPLTRVTFRNKPLDVSKLLRKPSSRNAESLFYIPAHRSMLISDGWAAPFQ